MLQKQVQPHNFRKMRRQNCKISEEMFTVLRDKNKNRSIGTSFLIGTPEQAGQLCCLFLIQNDIKQKWCHGTFLRGPSQRTVAVGTISFGVNNAARVME